MVGRGGVPAAGRNWLRGLVLTGRGGCRAGVGEGPEHELLVARPCCHGDNVEDKLYTRIHKFMS